MTNDKPAHRTDALPLGVAAATGAACATSLLAGFVYTLTLVRSAGDLLDPSFYGMTFYVGVSAATVAAIICPLLFLVVGLPLHALAHRHKWTSAWAYATVGLAVSCAAAIAAGFVLPLNRGIAVPLTIVAGTVATLTFWAVARPDKLVS